MKKKILTAIVLSLLATSAFSLGFAKKSSVSEAPPVTYDGFSAWSS